MVAMVTDSWLFAIHLWVHAIQHGGLQLIFGSNTVCIGSHMDSSVW